MKLSEMLAQIGDENITFQVLHVNVAGIKNGKKDSRIEFFTSSERGSDLTTAIASNVKPKMTGFVVWVPTELIPKS